MVAGANSGSALCVLYGTHLQNPNASSLSKDFAFSFASLLFSFFSLSPYREQLEKKIFCNHRFKSTDNNKKSTFSIIRKPTFSIMKLFAPFLVLAGATEGVNWGRGDHRLAAEGVSDSYGGGGDLGHRVLEPFETCSEGLNLGPELSEAYPFDGVFPPVFGSNEDPVGFDNAVSLLVGKNFISSKGSEIEGRVVVLGNVTIEADGINSIVRAGKCVYIYITRILSIFYVSSYTWFYTYTIGFGSQVVPDGSEAVFEIGGSYLHLRSGDTNVLVPDGDVDIAGVYETQNEFNLLALGMINTDVDIDKPKYQEMFDVLAEKSEFWSTLPPNGAFTFENGNTFVLSAGDEECVQVFQLGQEDVACSVWAW